MAYIESHQSLLSHPKTRRLARALNMPAVHVMGHLHALWHWALDYAQDGDLTRFDATDVADAAAWEGDPDTWLTALVDCGAGGAGFLERTDAGALVIHDWPDYAGKLIDRRKANAERMRQARATHETPTVEPRAAHVQRTSEAHADTCGANVTKLSVTKQNVTEPTVAASHEAQRAGASARVRPAPKPKREYPQNPTWDAVAALCGKPVTENERSDFAKTISQLDAVDATLEQIAAFPLWWREHHGHIRLSHRCFRDHWGECINAPPPPPPQISDLKSERIKAAMTTDVSDIYAKHEAARAERINLSGKVDIPQLPAAARGHGT